MPQNDFAVNLRTKLNQYTPEQLSSRSDSFKELRPWIEAQLDVDSVRVTYLSNLSKDFTARVGQAVLSMPTVIILMSNGEKFGKARRDGSEWADKLEQLASYCRLSAILALSGSPGAWELEFVFGPADSSLLKPLGALLSDEWPDAQIVPAAVAPRNM